MVGIELEEVVLDVEVAVNNQPLGYMEDDVQLPVLTPNSLLYRQPSIREKNDTPMLVRSYLSSQKTRTVASGRLELAKIS